MPDVITTRPQHSDPHEIHEYSIALNGTRLNVAIAGNGPDLLLVHGFPHTWRIWQKVIPALATSHRVIAPDLRGLGGSERSASGYDAATVSDDLRQLLESLDAGPAAVIALDAGVPAAFLLAMQRPDRVARLVLMESLVGMLPGAEHFLSAGPPWWFGFHAVPGLAERVLLGHEREYVDFFLRSGVSAPDSIDADIRDAILDAYEGELSLRCAFEYYRAASTNVEQVAAAAAGLRLRVPTMTIGGNTVGEATFHQLEPFADDLVGHLIPSSAHIIPMDRPRELLELLDEFL